MRYAVETTFQGWGSSRVFPKKPRLRRGDVGPTPLPGCQDEGLLAQKARGVRGAVRTDGVADYPSEGDVVVR